jgi:hypothetical protein
MMVSAMSRRGLQWCPEEEKMEVHTFIDRARRESFQGPLRASRERDGG